MSKNNNVIRNLLIIITIILVTIVGITIFDVSNANTDEGHEDTYSPTGDRTYIRLVHSDNNKVDVYLEFADTTVVEETDNGVGETNGGKSKPGASVSSFQIGLNIDIDLEDKNSVINFEFDSKLKDNKDYKLMKTTKEFIEEPVTGEKKIMGEKLHIFYVSDTELNDSRNAEGIKVGTISFDGITKLETVTITPDKDFTKLESIGYGYTDIDIEDGDSLQGILINAPKENDDNENANNETEGNNSTTGGENGGSNSNNELNNGSPNDNENDTNEKPNTGDIAIGVFVALMIVSFIGLILLSRKKKSKHSK